MKNGVINEQWSDHLSSSVSKTVDIVTQFFI